MGREGEGDEAQLLRMPIPVFCFLFYSEAGSHIAQAGLELAAEDELLHLPILLSPPPESWDPWLVPPQLVEFGTGNGN